MSIKIYLNKTRISASKILLCRTLIIKRGLRLCELAHEISNFPPMEDWNSGNEMEGKLRLSKIIAALSKHENLCVPVHGPVVKIRVHQHPCANEVLLVDLDAWG